MDEKSWCESEESTIELLRNNCIINEETLILDVGVGMGRLLSRLKTGRHYGMDITLDYLRIASQKGINCIFSK